MARARRVSERREVSRMSRVTCDDSQAAVGRETKQEPAQEVGPKEVCVHHCPRDLSKLISQ